MFIKTLHMEYESLEEFDGRVNQFLHEVDDKHWELSVTPSVTNTVEGVDYFITIVYKVMNNTKKS